MEYVTLNNGVKMPIVGFGTYFINVKDTFDAVYSALSNNYRHLDTAKWYVNEDRVADAIKKSKVKRKELFITCKIEAKGYNEAIADVNDTLKKLDTDYLDLILIHWPTNKAFETYKALEYLYENKITRSIGVSNFNQELCEYLLKTCKIKPQVNQIETHIYFQEKKMNKYLNDNDICHESWSPFAEGVLNLFEDELIVKLSKKYKKTPAQVMLRFMIQKGIVVIPRSTNEEHIKQNIDVFDFVISDKDMLQIEKIDKKKQLSNWPKTMSSETKY